VTAARAAPPGRPGRILGSFLAAAMLVAAATVQARTVIPAEEAHERAQHGELTLIDIRSPREWRDTGVPVPAKTVTIHQPGGPPAFHDRILAAVDGDKSRPIAVICAVGGRSSRAYSYLTSRGFQNVYNVIEGMLGRSADQPGWIAKGLPVQPCPHC